MPACKLQQPMIGVSQVVVFTVSHKYIHDIILSFPSSILGQSYIVGIFCVVPTLAKIFS